MLRNRSLDDLSIEDLCAEVDATVGAFYSRFDSKEVYFGALLTLAARDGEAMLAQMTENGGLNDLALADLCTALVAGITGWMRKHEGVLRAALQRSDAKPARWSPFKALAQQTAARAEPVLLKAMGGGRSAARTTGDRIRFAGRAGNACQCRAQRSRSAVAARCGTGRAAERLPGSAARGRSGWTFKACRIEATCANAGSAASFFPADMFAANASHHPPDQQGRERNERGSDVTRLRCDHAGFMCRLGEIAEQADHIIGDGRHR